MATKNISITEEAYNRLARLKKGNESFSEIVIRITGRSNLDNYVGILSKEAADELERNIRRLREKHRITRRARIRRIVKELG